MVSKNDLYVLFLETDAKCLWVPDSHTSITDMLIYIARLILANTGPYGPMWIVIMGLFK